jgi:cellulose biosynthesis protein BcsQ
MKTIVLAGKKGGIGKTTTGMNLALDLEDFYLLSNDDSVIESHDGDRIKIMEDLKLIQANAIYDMGGFVKNTKNISEIFIAADIIICPTFLDVNSIKRLKNTVEELRPLNKKLTILVNNVKSKYMNKLLAGELTGDSKIDSYMKVLKDLDLSIFFIRESAGFIKCMTEGKSLLQTSSNSKLEKYVYRNIINEYSMFLNFVKQSVGLAATNTQRKQYAN